MYWSVDEILITRGSQEPNPVLLLGTMVQYLIIQTSQNITTANNKNQLYTPHRKYEKYKNITDRKYYC